MTPLAKTAYGRNAILTASPAALVVMLCDRLVLDLKRAKEAQEVGDWVEAHNQLIHAQAILAELMKALNVDAWDGAENLMAQYWYMHQGLVLANIHRDVARTVEVLELAEPLAETWRQAAEQATSGGTARGSA